VQAFAPHKPVSQVSVPQQYLFLGLPPVLPGQSLQPKQSSPLLQTPSLLQTEGGQTPQSLAQLLQLSPPSQTLSPQTLAAPQSDGQLDCVSPPLHLLSPQEGLAAIALALKNTKINVRITETLKELNAVRLFEVNLMSPLFVIKV
jgi:hypothetical protein